MDVGVPVDVVEGTFHGVPHAGLVEETHVEHLEALVHEHPFLAGIDAAQPDLTDVVHFDGGFPVRHAGQFLRSVAEQAGHRHAVDVPGGGEFIGVDVGVGVHPDDAQLLAGPAAVRGDGADAADGQAVVAAHQHRHPAVRQFGGDCVAHRPVPLDHLRQVAVAVDRRALGIRRPGDIARVADIHSEGPQGFSDTGDT